MATIIIRNLDDVVADRLRLRARLDGVSVEEEARRLLTEGTKLTRQEVAKEAAAVRARQTPHKSRAVDIIRQYRDRPTVAADPRPGRCEIAGQAAATRARRKSDPTPAAP
jgi:plasmid stability protein